MFAAPSRYARIIRVVVPFAAFCGLAYLFLITFIPDSLNKWPSIPEKEPAPTHKRPSFLDSDQFGRHERMAKEMAAKNHDETFQRLLKQAMELREEEDKKEIEAVAAANAAAANTDESEQAHHHHRQPRTRLRKQQDDVTAQRQKIQDVLREMDRKNKEFLAANPPQDEQKSQQQQEDLRALQDAIELGDELIPRERKPSGPIVVARALVEDNPTEADTEVDDAEAENIAETEEEEVVYEVERANGAFVILTNEAEIQAARETIRQVEDRFNRGRNYPWIVLSPLPLLDRSKTLTKSLSKGQMTFGTIPREQWKLPKWIEAPKIISADYDMLKHGLNKTRLPLRHQWRYQSGLLALHPLLDSYEYIWRIDPGLEIFCDLEVDPMLEMKKNGQKFAWSVAATENEVGTPSAWPVIQKFKEVHPELIPKVNDETFLARETGDAFTTCAYGVQNSIGRVDFFRSDAYRTYFDFIDQEGVMYYEKWTDSVVMTIGVSLLLPRTDILYMRQFGWSLGSLSYCPRATEYNKNCHCDPNPPIRANRLSCTPFWLGVAKSPRRKERLECNDDGKCILYVDVSEIPKNN